MRFKILICLLMMGVIFPWGAYTSPPVAHAQAQISQTATDGAGLFDAKGAELSARKTCRTANLPGSPCGPDPVLPQGQAAPMPPQGASPKPDSTKRLAQGRSLIPPRAPPRLI
ncbi:hypothetical protein [Pseudorhodobacter ferrugineus]|uniref:hypothetical protein n=1 Tax=Pseudorhodobacter ferrugineus TaxID=77008 RepID=UPI000B0967EA|nr:hypothetical protein [Pseudorhodobacter ferrugineus]